MWQRGMRRQLPPPLRLTAPPPPNRAEYGFAAHWRYKEVPQDAQDGPEGQDKWLERLVQWKKWVAAKKLGIVDGKVRRRGV